MQFNELSLADGTKDAVAAMGYETATPIQELAIPHLMAGRDLIGKAQTGTGKTGAFGIPLIDRLRDSTGRDVQALILVPTRELALQVTEVLTDLARGCKVNVVPVFGGTGFGKQIDALAKNAPKIVVACPGRLLDLVGRGDCDISRIDTLILDEADRMLDMGFIHDMRRVLTHVPRDRRTSLWSATISNDIRKLARDFLIDPVTIEAPSETEATTLTDQFHIKVEKTEKIDVLLRVLHEEQPGKAVVFTRTKHVAKRLAQKLENHGWAAVALQGNMSQNQRERAMDAFRRGYARIMVATDVAARGLDVPDVTHVVNFDIPTEPESYVHRVGRTGRNGATGRSFAFVQSDEHHRWRDIKRLAGLEIPHHRLGEETHKGPDESTEVRARAAGAAWAPAQPQNPPRKGRQSGSGKPRHSAGGAPSNGPRAAGSRTPAKGGGNRGPRRSGGGGRGPRSPRQASRSS